MNKIITTEESDIELDPESLTDNLDVNNVVFKNKNKMLEAIDDLDKLIDANVKLQQINNPETKQNKRYSCFIRVRSKNTNHEFNMNFKLIGLNQGVIERNSSELELEASEEKLIKFFAFYQNNISTKKHEKKIKNNVKQLKVLLAKHKFATRKKRRVIYKNDVYVINLNVNFNGKKIALINNNNELWRISEMSYKLENNRATCRVSLTRTH